jgi:hypothetical protein
MRVKLVPIIALVLICVGASAVLASDMGIERVSVASDGTQGNNYSRMPSMNNDGRYVAFHSSANNLVPDDTNGCMDIFVRDRQTNTTTLVSVSDNSTQSNGTSELPSISNDGRYVAFDSLANNLVPNDINGFADIFVRDRQTNTTTRVSASDNGTEGNNLSSLPSISGDGRYVVFWSNADNLISNDTNGTRDIFVHDRQANTITRVSVASDGTQANAESELNSISGDGRYIAFDSRASNLVPNDTSGAPDVIDVFVAENPLFEHLTTSAPVASATGTGTITISTSSGGIQSLTAVSQDELLCTSLPGNVSFPHGFLSFAITDITPGSTVTITITFPAPIPEGVQYWECLNGTWVDYTSLVGDDDGDEILTLSITDGGPGDGDGQINGEISDPGGPAMPISAPAKPRVSPALPRQLNQAQISLQYLSVNPHQAAANQPLTITGNVVNTGDQAGNYNLALKINGKVEQTRSVSVGPQATQPVKFTVAKPEPGTYTVDIGGQTVSFTILGASRNSGSPSRGGLLAILIIGIMLLAATVILLISRRPA